MRLFIYITKISFHDVLFNFKYSKEQLLSKVIIHEKKLQSTVLVSIFVFVPALSPPWFLCVYGGLEGSNSACFSLSIINLI